MIGVPNTTTTQDPRPFADFIDKTKDYKVNSPEAEAYKQVLANSAVPVMSDLTRPDVLPAHRDGGLSVGQFSYGKLSAPLITSSAVFPIILAEKRKQADITAASNRLEKLKEYNKELNYPKMPTLAYAQQQEEFNRVTGDALEQFYSNAADVAAESGLTVPYLLMEHDRFSPDSLAYQYDKMLKQIDFMAVKINEGSELAAGVLAADEAGTMDVSTQEGKDALAAAEDWRNGLSQEGGAANIFNTTDYQKAYNKLQKSVPLEMAIAANPLFNKLKEITNSEVTKASDALVDGDYEGWLTSTTKITAGKEALAQAMLKTRGTDPKETMAILDKMLPDSKMEALQVDERTKFAPQAKSGSDIDPAQVMDWVRKVQSREDYGILENLSIPNLGNIQNLRPDPDSGDLLYDVYSGGKLVSTGRIEINKNNNYGYAEVVRLVSMAIGVKRLTAESIVEVGGGLPPSSTYTTMEYDAAAADANAIINSKDKKLALDQMNIPGVEYKSYNEKTGDMVVYRDDVRVKLNLKANPNALRNFLLEHNRNKYLGATPKTQATGTGAKGAAVGKIVWPPKNKEDDVRQSLGF